MVVLNGFVKIHRKLIQWGWYQDNAVKGVFLHLLLTASYRESKWQGHVIQPGQVITSYGRMAKDLGFTVQNIRTAISKLISTGEITKEVTNRYQLITIVNWDDYQCNDESPTDKSTDQSTQPLTGNQQATNRQLTGNQQHRKNIKNKRIKEKNKNARAREEFFPLDYSSDGYSDETSVEARKDESEKPARVKDPYWGLSYDDEEEDDE